jgi:hypothetical protein
MNAERFFQELMLEAVKRDIKATLNKGMSKPFEVLVSVKMHTQGLEVQNAKICNN